MICNAPLLFHWASPGRICGKESCRNKLATIAGDKLCQICGQPLTLRQKSIGACETPQCQRMLVERKRLAVEAEQHLEQTRRASELRDRIAGSLAIVEPESYRPTPVPSFSRPLSVLDPARRDAFRAHLASTIEEAFKSAYVQPPESFEPQTPAADSASSSTPLSGVTGGGCATCGGFCCRTAGDRAYIMVGTIDRYITRHPGCTPEQVFVDYFDRLPPQSHEGSCVYHTASGCALPTSMRADICNAYLCHDLTIFERHARDTDTARAFFVSVDGENFQKAAFVSPGQFTSVMLDQKLRPLDSVDAKAD